MEPSVYEGSINVKGRRIIPNSILNRVLYKIKKQKYLLLMFIPGLIYYLVFHYGPMYGVQIAFKDYRILDGIWESPWIGLANFKELLSMDSFWDVFRNTVIISFYKLVFGFPAPIIFAVLINEISHKHFKKMVQSVTYLPHFISWVVLAGIFVQFLSPSIGPINLFMKYTGLKPVYFLADPDWFRGVLILTNIWKDIGWNSIIYLSALASINPEIYEAAYVDGVKRFQKIIYVTIPSLAPIITITLIFAIGRLINDDFDQIFNLYNPAVYNVADVISTYTYRKGLISFEYSFATAVGLFRNIIGLLLIILANSITKKVNEYGIW